MNHRCTESPAGERPPRGRPKLRSDAEQRALVVAAAGETFVATGYAGTTMDDVAARAGISKRTLYRLFGGKVELFGAVVAGHRVTMIDPPPDDDDTPLPQTLCRMFHLDLSEDAEERRYAFAEMVMREASQHAELAAVFERQGPQVAIELVSRWLAAQVKRGRLKLCDPRVAAIVLLNMVFGPPLKHPGKRAQVVGVGRREQVIAAIEIFLYGTASR